MGVRGDSQCTANFRTSADSRKVRLGCVERGCLCRLTLARDGCQWVASLGWRGIWRRDQSRGSGEAHQGSTEVSFRGGADTGTAVLLCHGKGGVGWGGMEVLHAGFGFQGASTHTRSTVEIKTFPSSRQDLSLRTPFPSLQPPSRPRDRSLPSCEQRKPLARLEGFGLSMLCSPSGSNCLCFRVG